MDDTPKTLGDLKKWLEDFEPDNPEAKVETTRSGSQYIDTFKLYRSQKGRDMLKRFRREPNGNAATGEAAEGASS